LQSHHPQRLQGCSTPRQLRAVQPYNDQNLELLQAGQQGLEVADWRAWDLLIT
jgi:hypothetical protein